MSEQTVLQRLKQDREQYSQCHGDQEAAAIYCYLDELINDLEESESSE